MTKLRLLILALTTAIVLNSCLPKPGDEFGELAFSADNPPVEYNPSFVVDTVKIDSVKLAQAEVQIGRIDQYTNDKVKMYVNLINDKSLLLTGAAENEWSKIWCEVIDSSNGEVSKPKFKIRNKRADESQPLAIALVMDHSGSMGNARALAVQNAIDEVISNKKDEDLISLIKYDHKVEVTQILTKEKDSLLTYNPKIGLKEFGGGTAIADGIVGGIEELSKAPKDYRKVVVIFTDGFENSSKVKDSVAISKALSSNVLICAVDFGNNIDVNYMKRIADQSMGMYKHIYLSNEFNLLFKDIYLRLNNFYVVEFESENYGDHFVTMKLCLPDTTITTNVAFNNDPLPGTLNLLNVYYDLGKASIQKTSDLALNKLYKLMKKKSNLSIELQGHTDSTGKADANLKLSKDRAENVRKILISKGIDANRIISNGFGDTKPVATNITDEGRQKNRRTEFRILNK